MFRRIKRLLSEVSKILGNKVLPLVSTVFVVGILFIALLPFKFLPLGGLLVVIEGIIGISIFVPIFKFHRKHMWMNLSTGVLSLLVLLLSVFDGDGLNTLEEINPLPSPNGETSNIREFTSREEYNFQNYITSIFFEDTDGDLLKDDYEKVSPMLVFNYYYPNNSSSDPSTQINDVCGVLNWGEDFDQYSRVTACLTKLPDLKEECIDQRAFFKANSSISIDCGNISLKNFDSVYKSLIYSEYLLN